jgi:hypothetical protein
MNLDEELERLRAKHQAANTYAVICYIYRRPDRMIFRGLEWSKAKQIADGLQERYDLRHPSKSSWTKRLYSAQCE